MRTKFKAVSYIVFLLFASMAYGVDYTALPPSHGQTSDWNTAADWSPAGVPGIGDNVTIPRGANMEIKSTTGSVNNITINSGGTLIIKTAGTQAQLVVYGNYTCNGTINSTTGAEASSIRFAGTSTHTISGAGTYVTENNKPCNWTTDNGTTLIFDAGAVISGRGNFTLGTGSTIYTAHPNGLNGSIATITPTGNPPGTGVTLPADTNYYFNGSSIQVTGALLTTANNVYIGIPGSDPFIGPTSLTFSASTTINGTLYNPNDAIFTGTVAVDGYDSEYVDIAENGQLITGFTTTSSTSASYPTYINRVWYTGGTPAAAKTITYTWLADDDNTYNWTAFDPPTLYINDAPQLITGWTAGPPRTITLSTISALSPTDVITIGRTPGQTLPVELSSFTALFSNLFMVTLQWVTQSETNVSGFRIYRNTEADLGTATMLNIFVPATNTLRMQVYVVSDEEVYQDGTYYYWLENLDMDGSSTLHGPISITVSFNNTGSPSVPLLAGLNKAYPNPFHPEVTLELGMEKAGWADVEIYNLKGQKVRTLYSGNLDKGNKTLRWDSKDDSGKLCANGVYFAIMRTHDGKVSSMKLTLMK